MIHEKSGLASPSDIPRGVTIPASHRSACRKIYRGVSDIAYKTICCRVVNHDTRSLQARIGIKEAGGSLRVNQF